MLRHSMKPCMLVVLVFLAFPAYATETDTTPATAEPAAIGEVTRDWLVLQREGGQASTIEQTLPGPVQDRIYQRYLQSFEYPIPENFYSRDKFREVQ